ncbi:MAG: SnoaL-like domain-containing protein [Streptomycetaceae bacterium]|nr:SnoaL-like domain-containing protein [Streptomycetaceae bacterium]
METAEDRKKVALDWLRASLLVDKDRLIELTGEDCTFFLTGDMPGSGWKTREQWLEGWTQVAAAVPTPFHVRVGSVTAEDDRVAIEAEATCELPDGRRYQNHYHFLLRIRDGKLRTLKEYFDTQHAARSFGIDFDLDKVQGEAKQRQSNLDDVSDSYTRT